MSVPGFAALVLSPLSQSTGWVAEGAAFGEKGRFLTRSPRSGQRRDFSRPAIGCRFAFVGRRGAVAGKSVRAALVAGILLKTALGCLGAVMVTSPDLAELRSAIEAGGIVRLAFDGTVTLPEAVTITKDTTVDATGHTVILDGGNTVRHFVVTNGATLRLLNLTLANGRFAAANGEINQGGGYGQGGSIFNLGGNLEVVGCTFTNN